MAIRWSSRSETIRLCFKCPDTGAILSVWLMFGFVYFCRVSCLSYSRGRPLPFFHLLTLTGYDLFFPLLASRLPAVSYPCSVRVTTRNGSGPSNRIRRRTTTCALLSALSLRTPPRGLFDVTLRPYKFSRTPACVTVLGWAYSVCVRMSRSLIRSISVILILMSRTIRPTVSHPPISLSTNAWTSCCCSLPCLACRSMTLSAVLYSSTETSA